MEFEEVLEIILKWFPDGGEDAECLAQEILMKINGEED